MSDAQFNAVTAIYLFDPLCGWCYGASPVLQRLEAGGQPIRLAPTGLFSKAGARPVDDAFADFAWSHDQRIAELSGQTFSQAYRDNVLGASGTMLDSGAATLALTAVSITEPDREFEALRAIQTGRYVAGRDVTRTGPVAGLLRDAGFGPAADRLAVPDEALRSANDDRISAGRRLMRSFGVSGLPSLVVSAGNEPRLVDSNVLFGGSDALAAELEAVSFQTGPDRWHSIGVA